LKGGYISTDIYPLCQALHKMFRDLEETDLWNAAAVKTTSEWYEVLSLADKIKDMLQHSKGDKGTSTGDGSVC
jgi:hypothetical protein